jgi:glyoxylase-like metal-dependent hydrolase (beta-lactamase superfamily II)
LQTNCYIAGCEETRKAVVIDPGDEAGRILSELDRFSLEVVYILNTHAHFDHIGANAALVKATGAPLAIHELDLPLLKERGGAKQFGFEIPESPQPTLLLTEGSIITFGRYSLRTIFTPGHTPGHVSFYAAGLLFDGDVLFAGGVGRTDLPGGDQDRLLDSIEKKLMVLPDETVVYSGHGPTTTIGQEREVILGYR